MMQAKTLKLSLDGIPMEMAQTITAFQPFREATATTLEILTSWEYMVFGGVPRSRHQQAHLDDGWILTAVKFTGTITLKATVSLFVVLSIDSANNINVSDSGDSRGAPSMIFRSAEIDKRFKAFVSHYMGDCQALVNMVNAGFYSINDVPSVVEVYNACFE